MRAARGGAVALRTDVEEIERRVEADPSSAEFAMLAELYRRAGRLDDARRVAVAGLVARPDDAAGRIALGLALLDLGETAAARYELERAMGSMAGGASESLFTPADGEATYRFPLVVALTGTFPSRWKGQPSPYDQGGGGEGDPSGRTIERSLPDRRGDCVEVMEGLSFVLTQLRIFRRLPSS